MSYNTLYTWGGTVKTDSHGEFIEHTDGALSVAFRWSGIRIDQCFNDKEAYNVFEDYYLFYDVLSKYRNQIVVENHGFRNRDSSVAEKYYQDGVDNIVRAKSMGLKVRKAIADELSAYSYLNSTYVVITLRPEKAFLNPAAKSHRMRDERIKRLDKILSKLGSKLPGYYRFSADEYKKLILKSTRPFYNGDDALPDSRFFMRENFVNKPTYVDGFIKNGSYYTKTILLVDYPDAGAEWYGSLAGLFKVDLHVSQILSPLDMGQETKKSATESEKSAESANTVGGEASEGKLVDHREYRKYINDNDLGVFNNTYIINISSTDLSTLSETYETLESFLSKTGLIETGRESVDLSMWRFSHPGMGYRSTFFRQDHSWQVAHMAPVLTFDSGSDKVLHSLGLTTTGSLVGINYQPNAVHHSLTAAATGAGKSAYKASTVCELYPMGFDFLIVDVGRSFEWVVRAFGGDYFVLDADTAVVSPLPSYSYAKQEWDEDIDGLKGHIINPTLGCLLPMLLETDDFENVEGKTHYQSALEDLVNAIYILDPDAEGAPTLQTLLDVGNETHEALDSAEKVSAAKKMLSSLDSFLSRSEGQVFKKSDSIDFDKPLLGVDFSELLDNGYYDLASYLLSFISTRFKQITFARSNPVFSIYEEFHDFVSLRKKMMMLIQKEQTKKGRKKSSYFAPISQDVEDMIPTGDAEAGTAGVVNQYAHIDLMYYGTEFGNLENLLKIPERPYRSWESFKNPYSADGDIGYRRCMKKHGDSWYDLELRPPRMVMNLVNSTREALDLKESISKVFPVDINSDTGNGLLGLELFDRINNPSGSDARIIDSIISDISYISQKTSNQGESVYDQTLLVSLFAEKARLVNKTVEERI